MHAKVSTQACASAPIETYCRIQTSVCYNLVVMLEGLTMIRWAKSDIIKMYLD